MCIHVPGHTSGSLAFYSGKDGCVFTGDALFAGSIGRQIFMAAIMILLIDSIRTNYLFFLLQPLFILVMAMKRLSERKLNQILFLHDLNPVNCRYVYLILSCN